MLALALAPSKSLAEKLSRQVAERQGYRLRGGRKTEYSLETVLGYLHLVCLEGEVAYRGDTLAWSESILPRLKPLTPQLLQAKSAEELIQLLQRVEGFYAGLHATSQGVTLFRDHAGVKPLSYVKQGEVFLAASSRHALPGNPTPLKPGHILTLDKEPGINRWYSPPKMRKTENPPQILAEELRRAMEAYLPRGVWISFSGGLDSSLLAYLTSTIGKSPKLVSVGVEGCLDLRWSREAADMLGVELLEVTVDRGILSETLRLLVKRLPEVTPMNLALSSLYYIASSKVDGYLALGQGADELFGGYMKYEKALLEVGEREAARLMEEDLENLHLGLERDELASTLGGSQPITPYLARPIYELATSLTLDWKLRRLDGTLERKYVLREAARTLGVPERLVRRPKKAAQYGSGLQKLVETIVKEEDLDFGSPPLGLG